VDNAAIVSALVAGDAVFFFNQQQTQAREPARGMHGGGKADDASADYHNVEVLIGHVREAFEQPS
jgi:hypothetical protein